MGSSSERQAPTRRDLSRTEAQRGVLSGYHTGNINIYPFLMFESTFKSVDGCKQIKKGMGLQFSW